MKQKTKLKDRISDIASDKKRKKTDELLQDTSWKFYEALKGLQPLIISGLGVGVIGSYQPGIVVMGLLYLIWGMGTLGYFIRLFFGE